MICPSCSAFLTEKSLIKTDVKTWGNAEIEYSARCPACNDDIGRVSWGKLIVRPDLHAKQDELPEGPAGEVCCCPHCGGELPADLSSLPRKAQ